MEPNKVVLMNTNDGGEDFIHGTYNEISVLIRKSDGYINATVLCNQFNKRFRKLFENKSWQEYYHEFLNNFKTSPNTGEYIYELSKGFAKRFAGSYVHPKLINYIMFWASPRYAVYVCEIMDLINERNQLTNQDLNDTINQLQDDFAKLKKENQQLLVQNQKKDHQIYDESVRIPDTQRKLYILKLKDAYKFSADSYNSVQRILDEHEATSVEQSFVFPSSMV